VLILTTRRTAKVKSMRLAIVYTIIALIATAANLGAQELTVRA
jgi:hypothetical protein